MILSLFQAKSVTFLTVSYMTADNQYIPFKFKTLVCDYGL